jgi:hypothetical protein
VGLVVGSAQAGRLPLLSPRVGLDLVAHTPDALVEDGAGHGGRNRARTKEGADGAAEKGEHVWGVGGQQEGWTEAELFMVVGCKLGLILEEPNEKTADAMK